MTTLELTDAQRRLLAMVAERLPDGQVRELYLFAPIRQGGVETGLAVIAASEPADVNVGLAEPEFCAPEDADVMRAAMLAAEAAVAATDETTVAATDEVSDVSDVAAAAAADAPACDPTDAAAGTQPVELDVELDLGPEADADEPPGVVEEPAAPVRYIVYTARYRLQLKGPDRGRWTVELVAEADAPLLTVDAVVRGVQRRSGELVEVERLTGPELVRVLGVAP